MIFGEGLPHFTRWLWEQRDHESAAIRYLVALVFPDGEYTEDTCCCYASGNDWYEHWVEAHPDHTAETVVWDWTNAERAPERKAS